MITEIELLENGFAKTDDPMFPFEKQISIVDSDNEQNELKPLIIAVCAHNDITGTPAFTLILPEMGQLVLNIISIDQLKAFENMIAGYSPDW